MKTYLKAIQGHIRKEYKGDEKTNGFPWLTQMIKNHGYWIRRDSAKYVSGKLGIQFHQLEYYCDM